MGLILKLCFLLLNRIVMNWPTWKVVKNMKVILGQSTSATCVTNLLIRTQTLTGGVWWSSVTWSSSSREAITPLPGMTNPPVPPRPNPPRVSNRWGSREPRWMRHRSSSSRPSSGTSPAGPPPRRPRPPSRGNPSPGVLRQGRTPSTPGMSGYRLVIVLMVYIPLCHQVHVLVLVCIVPLCVYVIVFLYFPVCPFSYVLQLPFMIANKYDDEDG